MTLLVNGEPLGSEGINNVKNPINALTAVGALMTLIAYALSNARRFYSSMGNPLAVKGLSSYPADKSPSSREGLPQHTVTRLPKIVSWAATTCALLRVSIMSTV